jgi:hypothetical protein
MHQLDDPALPDVRLRRACFVRWRMRGHRVLLPLLLVLLLLSSLERKLLKMKWRTHNETTASMIVSAA